MIRWLYKTAHSSSQTAGLLECVSSTRYEGSPQEVLMPTRTPHEVRGIPPRCRACKPYEGSHHRYEVPMCMDKRTKSVLIPCCAWTSGTSFVLIPSGKRSLKSPLPLLCSPHRHDSHVPHAHDGGAVANAHHGSIVVRSDEDCRGGGGDGGGGGRSEQEGRNWSAQNRQQPLFEWDRIGSSRYLNGTESAAAVI